MKRLSALVLVLSACGGKAAVEEAPPPPPPAGPAACAEGTACNQRLDDAGSCAGACVAIEDGNRCRGVEAFGLCHGGGLVQAPDRAEGGPFEIALVSKPGGAAVGDVIVVEVRVTNTSGARAETTAGLEAGERWELLSEPRATLSLDTGESRVLQVTLRAGAPSALEPFAWEALRVTLSDSALERRGLRVEVPIGYAPGPGMLACGGRHFPEAGDGYHASRCCGGVFYPGATCCTSADCGAGVCADGSCVATAPKIAFSGSPLIGPKRVLVVVLDEGAAVDDVCADRVGELRPDLESIERWYAEVARARAGREMASFHWTVLRGLTSDAVGATDFTPAGYARAVEQAVVARGCTPAWSEGFDRAMVVSPRITLSPYRGIAYAIDRVAMLDWNAELAAHELGHTFGATDLYLDGGGSLQFARALMSWIDDDLSSLRDHVLRAEVGLADVDGDRELDALRFATAPERLTVERLVVKAFPASKNLSFELRVRAVEGGRTLRVPVRAMRLSLPDAGASFELKIDTDRVAGEEDLFLRYASAPNDLPEAAFEAIVASGRVRVAVSADHFYTDSAFSRRKVALDEAREVPVEVMGTGGNPGPFPGGGHLRAAPRGCL